jgi:hypothetical protein
MACADVAQPGAGLDLGDALPHAFEGDGTAAGQDGCVADAEHAAGVAVPAVLDDGDVEVDDVALLQRRGRSARRGRPGWLTEVQIDLG